MILCRLFSILFLAPVLRLLLMAPEANQMSLLHCEQHSKCINSLKEKSASYIIFLKTFLYLSILNFPYNKIIKKTTFIKKLKLFYLLFICEIFSWEPINHTTFLRDMYIKQQPFCGTLWLSFDNLTAWI